MEQFIDLYGNDMFSYFKGVDLQYLLLYIKRIHLGYRDMLGLPSDVTFGPEIEFENLSNDILNQYLLTIDDRFFSQIDGSLNNGGEFNSFLMKDSAFCWDILKKVCVFLKKNKADVSHNAGGHIHVGAHVLGSDCDAWRKFLKMYIAYECVLFRFFYGDKIYARNKIMKYASPVADILYQKLSEFQDAKEFRDIFYALPMNKYQAISFWSVNFIQVDLMKKGHTIEFRMPNGSDEEIIWQNNINTCSKMLISSKSDLDEEFLDYKLDKERVSSRYDFCLYQEVLLKNSLEFVDMVFNCNIDKVYFLKQYFKNFEIGYHANGVVKAKKLFF